MISGKVYAKDAALFALCEKYGVLRLDLFGSATSSETPRDLDFLVSFAPMPPEDHADAYFGLLAALQDLFGCPIDLVEESAIRNPYFRKGASKNHASGFMSHEAPKYIHDMLDACGAISALLAASHLDDYLENALLRSAVERQFQIIGEALFQLRANFPEVAQRIPDHRDIINFRHVIVHGYDQLDDAVVWGLVKRRLPALESALRKLAAETK